MKRKLFNYPFGLIMSALMLIFSATSCTKKTSDVGKSALPEEFATASSASKGGPSTVVNLKMTVNNTGNNITGDALGDYVNGSENVSLYFSSSGNLQFSNSASRSKPTTRWLNVNLNSPRPTYIERGILQCGFISTLSSTISPNPTLLQNLVKGTTKCITLSAGVPGGVINFHNRSYEDTDPSQSSYVYVTRISATPGDPVDQWLMTAVPPTVPEGCSTIYNVAAYRNGATLFGYYNMPFSFTLTKL